MARVVGLLMAAGRGRRFDAAGDRDKLLQRIGGRPVAGHALDAMAAGCDAVVAVIRPDAPPALAALLRDGGAQVVVCADADMGMGHSLACAAIAAMATHPPPDAVLVLPADMPWLRAETVAMIAGAARLGSTAERESRIVVPRLPDGRRGHPVGFGGAHLAALAALRGDRGARGLLDAHPTTPIDTDDAGILRDVDTPSDLPPT
jgi:molybdenum cofactor cytidylyltransferase